MVVAAKMTTSRWSWKNGLMAEGWFSGYRVESEIAVSIFGDFSRQ
jgi:hypothetical protein